MFANALFAATLVCLALLLLLLQEVSFLAPHKRLLWQLYAEPFLWFMGALLFNLCALFHTVARKVQLKDTGRKLAHLQKQLSSGEGLNDELAERIKE